MPIPVFVAADVQVVDNPRMRFPGHDVWFGKMHFRVNGEDYKLERFLNLGAEGQTYTAMHVATGRRLATKFCTSLVSAEIQIIQAMPQQLLEHANFVRYEMILSNVRDHFRFAHHVVFMEEVPHGELFDLIAAPGTVLSEGTSRRLVCDIIRGMAASYTAGVGHRDLKPDNLMIGAQGVIKIIDLDQARMRNLDGEEEDGEEEPLTFNPHGTLGYKAPEVDTVGAGGYNYELADVWSIGVCAFIMHSKLPPFQEGRGVAALNMIQPPDNALFWARIEGSGYYRAFPPDFKAFLNALLRRDPTERPTFAQLGAAMLGDPQAVAVPGLAWLSLPSDAETFVAEMRAAGVAIEG